MEENMEPKTSEELGINSDLIDMAKNSPGSSVGGEEYDPDQQLAMAQLIAKIKAQRRRSTKGAGCDSNTTKLSRKATKKYCKSESLKEIDKNKTANLPKIRTVKSDAAKKARKLRHKILKSN